MFIPKRLYTVKEYCWFVFPTQEIASAAASGTLGSSRFGLLEQHRYLPSRLRYYTEHFGCLVTFVEPNSNFMVLEVAERFVKIVGDKIGWIVADSSQTWISELFEQLTS